MDVDDGGCFFGMDVFGLLGFMLLSMFCLTIVINLNIITSSISNNIIKNPNPLSPPKHTYTKMGGCTSNMVTQLIKSYGKQTVLNYAQSLIGTRILSTQFESIKQQITSLFNKSQNLNSYAYQ